MSDPLPSSTSSTSSRFAAWLARNPPRGHSRRRSESEALVVLQGPRRLSRTSSPPPAKRRCLSQTKSAPASPSRSSFSHHQSSLLALSDPLPLPTSLETPKPAQPQRKPQSYVKRRARRIIRIINATYAVCEGKPATSAAYPVRQTDLDRFLVPATLSDFETLRQYQGQSNALWASTRFERRPLLPDSTTSTPCISVKMPDFAHETLKTCISDIRLEIQRAGWKVNGKLIGIEDCSNTTFHLTLGDQASRDSRDLEPDGSLRIVGASFPFLVCEIGNTQNDESLDRKIHHWTYGSRSHLKFIIIFRIIRREPRCVLVSVDKLEREGRPTPENPNRYITKATHVITDEEIYPKTSAETFDIALADILPEKANDHSAPVTISLRSFGGAGMRAVQAIQAKENNPGNVSPRDTNEVSVPTPASSDHRGSTSSSASSDNDRPDDKTYKGKDIDRDGSRGSGGH